MKIFLDCGTHKGEGLVQFYNGGLIKDGYKVYCFEPIPNITDLEKIKSIVADNGNLLGDCLNIDFKNAAIWIEDGELTFNSRNDHAAHVDGIGYVHEGEHTQEIVKAVDLGEFVKNLPTEAYIVCKMDIEGSEFKVLRHMLDNNTIERINEIYIEFHPHLMSGYSNDDVNQLVGELQNKTKIFLWH
jgi:FkbM family methyltransferase